MCSFFLKLLIPVAVVTVVLHLYSRSKEPVFSHDVIADLVREVLKEEKGESVDVILQGIRAELVNRYGDHILPSSEWLFVNCGGWMGSMYLLHASLNEYVMFFALGIDTSGHSGRYYLNITDTLVSGTMKQWPEGGLAVREYKVGDTVVHEPGEVAGVQWTGGTVMVEHANGFIPYALPFALADSIFSAVEFYNVFKILKVYAFALFNELMLGNF